MREVEVKFQVPAAQLKPLRRELAARGGRSMRLVARYFDTPDGRLAKERMSLRLRKEGRHWFQTLKAERASSVDRHEHNVRLRVPSGTLPVLDLGRHDTSEAGARLRQVLGEAGAGALVERYATDVTRLACLLPLDGALVEAALDIGVLRAGERELAICELELEHRSGDLGALFELARLWRRHGALWLDTRSKAYRGTTLAQGLDQAAPVKARAPTLVRDIGGPALLRAVVLACLEQVLGNASELADSRPGDDHEDHVHQLRVGLRRLRTALRELGSLVDGQEPGLGAGWEPVIGDVFGQLGAIRDDQTVAAAVRPLLLRGGAPTLAWQPADVSQDAGTIVRAEAFQDTLLDLLRWALSAPPAETPGHAAHAPQDARGFVVGRLARLHKQVTRGGKRFEQLPEAEQHQVRKRLKRLRYLSEFVAGLWPPKATQRFLRHLAPAQDALGHHNDVAVAAARFLADAQREPLSLYAAGYLKSHLDQTARASHAALAEVAAARGFWKD